MDIVAFIPLLTLCFVLGITAAWIAAERREHLRIRVGLGIATVALWAILAGLSQTIIPTYERGFHRRSLHELEVLLKDGEVDLAKRAIAKDNAEITCSGSTYNASRQMLRELRGSKEEGAR